MAKPYLLGLTTNEANARVFQCPRCNETTNTGMHRCPACGTLIDQNAAQASADLLDKVGQACTEAEYLRIAVTAPLLCFFLGFFLPGGFFVAFFFAAAVLFMVVRWWVRFYGLKTGEPDYKKARLYMIGIVLAAIFFFFLTTGFILATLLGG